MSKNANLIQPLLICLIISPDERNLKRAAFMSVPRRQLFLMAPHLHPYFLPPCRGLFEGCESGKVIIDAYLVDNGTYDFVCPALFGV